MLPSVSPVVVMPERREAGGGQWGQCGDLTGLLGSVFPPVLEVRGTCMLNHQGRFEKKKRKKKELAADFTNNPPIFKK